MNNIKIISDFDGIWTNQEEEAKYVRNFTINEIANVTKLGKEEINNTVNMIHSEMNKTPHLYGWRFNREIPAFYGEDPFGDNNAIFDFIEINYALKKFKHLGNVRKKIIDAGFESPDSFANFCFTEGTRSFMDKGKLNPCKNAKDTVEKLLDSGAELVVVSNSGTEKIKYLFEKMGYQLNKREIRAIGNSMKFVIEKDYEVLPSSLEISKNYRIPLRRKSYHKILLEEKPDVVVGDVFSLDIALPLFLRLNDEKFGKLKIIQKIQKHTPEWVKDYLKKEEFKGIVYLIEDIEELPVIIERFKD